MTLTANTRNMERDIRRALDRVDSGTKITPRIDTSGASGAGRDFMSRFSAAGGGAARSAGSSIGRTFIGAFSAILAAGGVQNAAQTVVDQFQEVLSTGLDFSRTLNNFQGVTRASAQEMAQMQAAARQLGSDVNLAGASSSDAALAMTELAKAGFSVDQAIGAARGTLQLATAGQIDAARAAEIQANAMNAFGLGAESAAHTADLFANAAIASSADIPDLGMALQQVGGVAQGFGENLDDTVAALAMFANAGIKGSDAGTLLKTTMQSITDQGNPAQGAIQNLGLELYKLNAAGENQFVGFRELFRQLDEAKRRINDPEIFQAQTNILFGSDAMRAALLGNADAFDDMLGKVSRLGGASEMAAAQMKGLPGAVEGFKNTAESIRLDAFDAIGPAFTDILGKFTQGMINHKDEIVQMFVTIGDAAITMGKFVVSAFKGMADIMAPIFDLVGLDSWAESARSVSSGAESMFRILDDGQTTLQQYAERSAEASKFTKALGDSVTTLKSQGGDVTIDVKDNTPEVQARLAEMGAHLETLESDPTRMRIVGDTQEAEGTINAYRQQQEGTPIHVPFSVRYDAGQSALPEWFKYIGGAAGPAPLPVAIQGGPTTANLPTASPFTLDPSGALVPSRPSGTAPPPAPRPRPPSVFRGPVRASGGLFSAMPSSAVIQSATPGLIQWAEPSTEGEAFIPLGGGERSRAIWAQTGKFLGMFDQGGFRGDESLLSLIPSSGRYSQGADRDLLKGLSDCSSSIGDLVYLLDKGTTDGPNLTTGNAASLLPGMGFVRGMGGPGDFRIGFNSGHMQATLPGGTPWNWGSNEAAARGGVGGTGADDPAFTEHFYRPADMSYFNGMGGGGYYEPATAKQLREAQDRVADAQQRLDIQSAQLNELKADAKESQRMQAQADVDKAKRELDQAKADLAETQRGEYKDGASGPGKSGSDSGGMGQNLGQNIISGMLQGLGLDGSVFSNPLEWPNVKSGLALANWGGGLLKSAMQGPESESTTNWAGGSGGPSLGGFGGAPSIVDTLRKPNVTTSPDAPHQGGGALPGPGGPTYVIQGNVGMNPRDVTQRFDAAHNQSYRRTVAAVRPK